MPAFYECKLCDGVHRLPGHFPLEAIFESVPLQQHVCTCPEVGRGAIYRDSDVFWREGRGSDTPVNGDRRDWELR